MNHDLSTIEAEARARSANEDLELARQELVMVSLGTRWVEDQLRLMSQGVWTHELIEALSELQSYASRQRDALDSIIERLVSAVYLMEGADED